MKSAGLSIDCFFQIMAGCGDGIVRLYYDPQKSHNGAKLCVVRTKTKAKAQNYYVKPHIITPYSLPMFREEKIKGRLKTEEKARKDPIKTRRPDLPQGPRGTGGRVAEGGATMHRWMSQQIAVKNKDDHIDPRYVRLEVFLFTDSHIFPNTELTSHCTDKTQ